MEAGLVGSSTRTFTVALTEDTFLDMAVMVTVPSLTGVTVPDSSTVATLGAEEVNLAEPSAVAGVTLAVRVSLLPRNRSTVPVLSRVILSGL